MRTEKEKVGAEQAEQALQNTHRNTRNSVLLMLISGLCNTVLVITVVPLIAVSMGIGGLIVTQAAMKVVRGVADEMIK